MKRRDHPASSTATQAKRLRSSTLESDDNIDNSSGRALRPRVDPTYGQRGAFPDIDDADDEALFYGPASDGLEYLRMVR